MYDEIKLNIGNPEKLETLFRSDRKAFAEAFERFSSESDDSPLVRFWKTRLDFDNRSELIRSFSFPEISKVIGVCLIVAILIKLQALLHFSISPEEYYKRNAAIIVFMGLSAYTFWMNKITDRVKIITVVLAFLIPVIYVNLLPVNSNSASINLVFIHLPVLMWFVYGVVFCDFDYRNPAKRISFIRYNGDLAIMYAIIAIAGGILTGITVGLFSAIGMNIGRFYSENIVFTGAAAAPVVASFLIERFPVVVNKTASIIAGIFSPIVLVTLVVFLMAMLITGKDPYNDRDFLLIFNVMLLGVMGIIIFSVSETSLIRNRKVRAGLLFTLSVISVIIDIVALSAIVYRLGEYGLSPNRLAVLVSNLLVFTNLVLIMIDFFGIVFRSKDHSRVELTTARFLPVYMGWMIFVVFLFPLIFGMK